VGVSRHGPAMLWVPPAAASPLSPWFNADGYGDGVACRRNNDLIEISIANMAQPPQITFLFN
jgi:hypothetical protein